MTSSCYLHHGIISFIWDVVVSLAGAGVVSTYLLVTSLETVCMILEGGLVGALFC